jgi:hypothetical protein
VRSAAGGRVTRKARKWYIDYTDYVDGQSVRRRVAGFTDKQATQQRALELQRKADRRRAGLIDRCDEQEARPLAEHVQDWHRTLIDKGATRT